MPPLRFLGIRHLLGKAHSNYGRVRLTQEGYPNETCNATEGCDNDEDVFDANRLGDEPACDGADNGAYEWAKGIESHSTCTLALGKEVADAAAANGDGSCACPAGCKVLFELW